MILKKFFTRHGGISHEPFDSLNIRFGIGDEEDDVLENRQHLCADLGIDMGQLISLNQIHSDKILKVDKNVHGEVDGYDAMITDLEGKFLMIQVADCQGVMLWDDVRSVIANVHNGWKGSVQNIVGKCIRKMVDEFGCDLANIKVEVSPSLGPCHAEFSDPYNELPKELHPFIDKNNHVNFWEATKKQCMDSGVPAENIHISGVCTACNTDKYFSYRADTNKEGTGRFAVIIGKK